MMAAFARLTTPAVSSTVATISPALSNPPDLPRLSREICNKTTSAAMWQQQQQQLWQPASVASELPHKVVAVKTHTQ